MSNKILAKLFLIVGLIALGVGAIYLKRLFMSDDLLVYSNNNTITVFDDPIPIQNLDLQSNQGSFTRQDLLGKWSFIFFGYTHCPDVCPTTLTLLQQVNHGLQDYPEKVQMIFITLDPARDTVRKIGEYVAYFNKHFIGLSGGQPEIDKLVKTLGVLYEKELPQKDGYAINHTASVFIVNPKAQVQALLSSQAASVAKIVTETRRLISAKH